MGACRGAGVEVTSRVVSTEPRLHVRVATPADAAAIREIYAPNIEASHTSFELEVPSVEEVARRVTDTLRTHPWLVAVEAGGVEVLGYAYATPHRARAAYQWCCESSVYVRSGVHRAGVGRTLYRALFEVLGRQGLRNVYAGIALPNAASVGLHESFGFTPVGVYRGVGFKLGAWRDVGWWHLALGDDGPPAGPPRPFDVSLLDGDATP